MPEPTAVMVGPRGRGSNMEELIRRCRGDHPARIELVIAPTSDSPALIRARELGVRTAVVDYEPIDTYGSRLIQALEGIRWICLAGFLRLVPEVVLSSFEGRILNIHPALLPKFGGKGMYGMRVHQAVLEAGEDESGCTVHFVNTVYDDGEIILKGKVPVLADDTPETLAARVLKAEHETYAEALKLAIERTYAGN